MSPTNGPLMRDAPFADVLTNAAGAHAVLVPPGAAPLRSPTSPRLAIALQRTHGIWELTCDGTAFARLTPEAAEALKGAKRVVLAEVDAQTGAHTDKGHAQLSGT